MDKADLNSDVIIIGAGPAGCVAATVLARAAFNVILIEQSRFPRDKVCGECLSALGIDVISRCDLRDVIQQHHPIPLERSCLYAADGTRVEVRLPRPMWGLSREVMDTALLSTAKVAGVHIRQPSRAEKIIPGSPPRVLVRDLQSNEIQEFAAGLVLLADGKGSVGQRRQATGDLGVKCHLTGVDAPADAIELFGMNGHYAGLAPIEGNRWNLAFSVPAKRVAQLRGDMDQLLTQMKAENESFHEQLRFSKRASDWLTCPLPRFGVASAWEENVIPLGNASVALEPIGGEGMGLAMASAELATGKIITARTLGRSVDTAGLQREFHALWNVRRLACRATAIALSNPIIAPYALQFFGDLRMLHEPAMRMLGKIAIRS